MFVGIPLSASEEEEEEEQQRRRVSTEIPSISRFKDLAFLYY